MLADRAVCLKEKKILFQVSHLYAGVKRAQNFINVRKPHSGASWAFETQASFKRCEWRMNKSIWMLESITQPKL